MPVETLDKPMESQSYPTSEKFPDIDINLDKLGAQTNKEILGLIHKLKSQKENYLSNQEGNPDKLKISDFFRKNKNKNQIVFQMNCNLESIEYIKGIIINFLIDREVIRGDERIKDFHQIADEIITNVRHSKNIKYKSQIAAPRFTIVLNNLNNPDNFSFDVINPDNLKVKNWEKSNKGQLSKDQQDQVDWEKFMEGFDSENQDSTGLGDFLSGLLQKELGSQKKHYDVCDPNGKKKYTLCHFELNPK